MQDTGSKMLVKKKRTVITGIGLCKGTQLCSNFDGSTK